MVDVHPFILNYFLYFLAQKSNTYYSLFHRFFKSNYFQLGLLRETRIETVFPPCNVLYLSELPLGKRLGVILSVGQFRPEKDHILQLRMFKLLLENYHERFKNVCLVMLGGSRNRQDEDLIEHLKAETIRLGIPEKNVVFEVNVTFSRLKRFLSHSSVGLHTMWNEHFGISVVEMMAAGLVVVAHNSGGPRDDIIHTSLEDTRTGYLATSPEEYADAVSAAFNTLDQENETLVLTSSSSFNDISHDDFEMIDVFPDKISVPTSVDTNTDLESDSVHLRIRARKSVARFSDEIFISSIVRIFRDILSSC